MNSEQWTCCWIKGFSWIFVDFLHSKHCAYANWIFFGVNIEIGGFVNKKIPIYVFFNINNNPTCVLWKISFRLYYCNSLIYFKMLFSMMLLYKNVNERLMNKNKGIESLKNANSIINGDCGYSLLNLIIKNVL